ncbi:hypothetical protein [Brevundimonas poindexterae]|uniref:hypothetical protein n=1 Tax=Brevundimonas poindexterae TaxID=74325 RepID=UPI001CFCF76A|nr:hypothetical protein [Brevundimonas poindexterae]
MKRLVALGVLAAASLTACDQTNETPASLDTASANPPLFDKQEFTIISRDVAGNATKTEYVRDWGHRRVEVFESPSDSMRVVYEGGLAWAILPPNDQVFEREDPTSDILAARISEAEGNTFGQRRMMASVGALPTGETGTFAGHECEYYQASAPGQSGRVRVCVADWGGVLYMKAASPGGEIEVVATTVRLGDGGPDSAFEFDRAGAQRVTPSSPVG